MAATAATPLAMSSGAATALCRRGRAATTAIPPTATVASIACPRFAATPASIPKRSATRGWRRTPASTASAYAAGTSGWSLVKTVMVRASQRVSRASSRRWRWAPGGLISKRGHRIGAISPSLSSPSTTTALSPPTASNASRAPTSCSNRSFPDRARCRRCERATRSICSNARRAAFASTRTPRCSSVVATHWRFSTATATAPSRCGAPPTARSPALTSSTMAT